MHSTIYAIALVYWSYIDLLSIGGEGWGMCALVSVHSSLCETYAVKGTSTHAWSIGGGVGSVYTGICAFFYM